MVRISLFVTFDFVEVGIWVGKLIFGAKNLKSGNLEINELFIVESIAEIPFYKKVKSSSTLKNKFWEFNEGFNVERIMLGESMN